MTEVVTKCSLLSQMLLGSLTFCNENLKELMVNSSVASDFPGNSCSPLCCCRNNTHKKKHSTFVTLVKKSLLISHRESKYIFPSKINILLLCCFLPSSFSFSLAPPSPTSIYLGGRAQKSLYLQRSIRKTRNVHHTGVSPRWSW